MAKFPDINNLVPFPGDMTSQHSNESQLDSFFVYCPELGQKEGTVRRGCHHKSRLSWGGSMFYCFVKVSVVHSLILAGFFNRRKERFCIISQKVFLWTEKSGMLDYVRPWSISPRPFLRTSHVNLSIRKRGGNFFLSQKQEYGWLLWVWSFSHNYLCIISLLSSFAIILIQSQTVTIPSTEMVHGNERVVEYHENFVQVMVQERNERAAEIKIKGDVRWVQSNKYWCPSGFCTPSSTEKSLWNVSSEYVC